MTVIMSRVDLERLNNRYTGLQLRLSRLQGRASELKSRQTRLVRDVSLAKGRRELAPQVMAAFTYLQEKAHARAVGQFEDLLSAFIDDVIPNEGKIRLELGTERGAPSLDIMLSNGGDLEDIYSGNGGAMTNVVVTALGFSALSRTRNRQLMLLDEPDCWIKSVNVPAFTKVISEVSNPRQNASGAWTQGCQTLMVSHNDVGLMDDGAHIQDVRVEHDLAKFAARLGADVRYVGDVTECAYVVWVADKRDEMGSIQNTGHIEVRYRPAYEGDEDQNALTKGFPCIENVSGARGWDEIDPNAQGVRWIELENVRRHIKTRLSPSCGLNVLTGNVNSGKSTLLFTPLRAMAYGESDDKLIRHGADQAVVRMGLEDDVVLEMVRSRKGTPKVLYRKYVAGVMVNEASQGVRGGVPSFISDALLIERVDDMDIQLRHQKEPVFLLNESGARRARLLSVGKESGLLQDMIERHRLTVRRDNEQIKRDEIELNEVNRTLTVLSPLASLTGLTEILTSLMADAQVATDKLAATRQTVTRLAALHGKARLGAAYHGDLGQVLVVPTLRDTSTISRSVARLAENTGKAQLPNLPKLVDVPALTPTQPLTLSIQKLSSSALKARLPSLGAVPSVPALTDTREISTVIGHIRNGEKSKIAVLLPATPVAPVLLDTLPMRQKGIALSKGADAIRKLEGDDKQAAEEHGKAAAAFTEFKTQLGVCPLCDNAFDGHHHA